MHKCFIEKFNVKIGQITKIMSCRFDALDSTIAIAADDGYIRLISPVKG